MEAAAVCEARFDELPLDRLENVMLF